MSTDPHITPEDARAYRKLISVLLGSAIGHSLSTCIDDPDWKAKTRLVFGALVDEVKSLIQGSTTPHVLAFLEDRVQRLITDETLVGLRGMLLEVRAAADPEDFKDVANRAQDAKRRRGY